MLPKRLDLPFWLSVGATALLMFASPTRRAGQGMVHEIGIDPERAARG